MAKSSTQPKEYLCSFCGKPNTKVKRLIAGPHGVYICDQCVEICREIIVDEEVPTYSPETFANKSSEASRVTGQLEALLVFQRTVEFALQHAAQIPTDSLGHLVRTMIPLLDELGGYYHSLLMHVESMRELEAEEQMRPPGWTGEPDRGDDEEDEDEMDTQPITLHTSEEVARMPLSEIQGAGDRAVLYQTVWGLLPRTVSALITARESPQEVYAMSEEDLQMIGGIGPFLAKDIVAKRRAPEPPQEPSATSQ